MPALETLGQTAEGEMAHACMAGVLGCLAVIALLQCPCQPTTQGWPTDGTLGMDVIQVLKGGHSAEVHLQLLFMGGLYPVDGFSVVFHINDSSIARFANGDTTYETRTVGGRASATIVSEGRAGTALLSAACCGLEDTALVRVVPYGTISGFVTDTHQHSIPGALVTLWPNASYNVTTGGWEHDPTTAAIDPFVPDNPQPAGDGYAAPAGTYTFTYVPLGVYVVEADASQVSGNPYHRFWSVVKLDTEASFTANVAIPGNITPTTATTAPTPTPTPTTVEITTPPPSTPQTTATTLPATTAQEGSGPLAALTAAIAALAMGLKGKKRRV